MKGTPVGVAIELTLPKDPGHPASSRAEAARDGDFAALAEQHSTFMLRVAYSLLRNMHDAEDAVQEALLKLYRTGGWLQINDEKAFLARTVWRVALDVSTRRPRSTGPIEPQADFISPDDTPEQATADGDQRALLRRLIDALPEDLRLPLLLSAIDGMTSREVAAALSLNEATVRTRISRARAELKRRYESMQLHGGNR
jgi:RNA polymerase sigma-70 factor (ECF subfamily)